MGIEPAGRLSHDTLYLYELRLCPLFQLLGNRHSDKMLAGLLATLGGEIDSPLHCWGSRKRSVRQLDQGWEGSHACQKRERGGNGQPGPAPAPLRFARHHEV
jgi:hypothetical protein